MTELMWIRSHVELLLQREWGVEEVNADQDGDFPYRFGTAFCWVSVLDRAAPMVRVFAHAVCGVKQSAKLLAELNDIQRRCLSASVMLLNGDVVVSQTISPISLTAPVLQQAMQSVGETASDIGELLATVFGGCTPFEAEVSDSEDAA